MNCKRTSVWGKGGSNPTLSLTWDCSRPAGKVPPCTAVRTDGHGGVANLGHGKYTPWCGHTI